MDAAGQAAADAAEAQAALDDDRAEAVTRASLDIGTRELVEVLLFETNKLADRVVELQNALTAVKATGGGSDNIRGAIPASFLAFQQKLRSEVLQKYVDEINAGNADP